MKKTEEQLVRELHPNSKIAIRDPAQQVWLLLENALRLYKSYVSKFLDYFFMIVTFSQLCMGYMGHMGKLQ